MACLEGIGGLVRVRETFRILSNYIQEFQPQPACLIGDWESFVGSIVPRNRLDATTTWPKLVNSLDRAGFR
jgi:hypothetical protein